MGDKSWKETADRHIRLQLCFLVPTLDSPVLEGLINFDKYLEMKMDTVSHNKPSFLFKTFPQLSIKPMCCCFFWIPLRRAAVYGEHAAITPGLIGEGRSDTILQ